jgi:homeobox-leucine zipper protein
MELALSLGDTPKLPFSFLDKPTKDPLPNLFLTQQGKTLDLEKRGSLDPPIQLDLLPFSPVLRSHHSSSHLPIPWLTQPCNFLFKVLFFLPSIYQTQHRHKKCLI